VVAQRAASPSDQRVTVTDEGDHTVVKVLVIDVARLMGLGSADAST
jgi:hypothetical protein